MGYWTKDQLIEARSLIENEKNWTVGTAVGWDDPDKFCLGGALMKVWTGDPTDMYSKRYENELTEFAELAELPEESVDENPDGTPFTHDFASRIHAFNDDNTHSVVLAALDRAISKLGG